MKFDSFHFVFIPPCLLTAQQLGWGRGRRDVKKGVRLLLKQVALERGLLVLLLPCSAKTKALPLSLVGLCYECFEKAKHTACSQLPSPFPQLERANLVLIRSLSCCCFFAFLFPLSYTGPCSGPGSGRMKAIGFLPGFG